jgi:anti-sigma regulatory factor (Ser/Thr protein kinase)
MNQDAKHDTVSIALPAQEQMIKVIRLATSAIANRCGLNIDQADDLNTAIDELFRLFASEFGGGNDFCMRYFLFHDRLEIHAEGCAALLKDTDHIGRYSRFLLETLTDGMEERPNAQGGMDFVITKRIPKH